MLVFLKFLLIQSAIGGCDTQSCYGKPLYKCDLRDCEDKLFVKTYLRIHTRVWSECRYHKLDHESPPRLVLLSKGFITNVNVTPHHLKHYIATTHRATLLCFLSFSSLNDDAALWPFLPALPYQRSARQSTNREHSRHFGGLELSDLSVRSSIR